MTDAARRRRVRVALAVLAVLSATVLVAGALNAPSTASAESVPQPDPRDGVTVVSESARHGTLLAWRPDGRLLYHNDTHTKYFDVDPVAGEALTVEYTATDTIHTSGPTCESPPCTRNLVERVNLSTGEVTRVYARYDPRELAGEWHDHERLDENHIAVADIVDNQVFVVDLRTELVTWRWDAQTDFPLAGGGPYPRDWAHINDVEVLGDGRLMVSLRNQDQVVFLDRGTGLVENWTLGTDGAHDVLYEQHNPDYIPAERGGPAVVVSDSENNRIVEYQRDGGEWRRTWTWQDGRLQWPRDADRLPGGTTLIADTHGSRVLEVDSSGEVVWSVAVPHPYDAERLGTGGGSAGGESAASLGLETRTAAEGTGSASDGFDPLDAVGDLIGAVLPSRVTNGVLFLAPVWMGHEEFAAAAVLLGVAVCWPLVELRWRVGPVGLRWPFYRNGQ